MTNPLENEVGWTRPLVVPKGIVSRTVGDLAVVRGGVLGSGKLVNRVGRVCPRVTVANLDLKETLLILMHGNNRDGV